MNKIYTKKGDQGSTSLVDGSIVSKGDHRIKIYGSIDELNSHIGLVVCEVHLILPEFLSILKKTQNELFNIGSNLACPEEKRRKFNLPQLDKQIISDYENNIDEMTKDLPELKNFILPGGHRAACVSHIVRTKIRSIERDLVTYKREHPDEIPPEYIKLFNRMSDFFFVFSRYINLHQEISEEKWAP
ncbi:MAG: cob(I)yrinic acid a,c-diamide adenosyltransferase [Halobacteriovoraceae bacterium]|nr:cob(I)yrinic acid a,c-diamide adenosyltransferase [Halobacteriovoraceae bacterium]